MNGVVFEYGRRYSIGLMDLAILADCEIPLKTDGLKGDKQPRGN